MSTNLDIEVIEKGNFRILKLKGRIDANWSLRLSESINAVIRGGNYDMVLDVSEVDYISSAGVRVLLMSYKELNKLNGSFALYRPCDGVKSIIEMMGLSSLFDCSKFEAVMAGAPSTICDLTNIDNGSDVVQNLKTEVPNAGFNSKVPDYGVVNGLEVNVIFRMASLDNGAPVKINGNVNKISDFSYNEEDVCLMKTSPAMIAFGLGAPGSDKSADALGRAGEFMVTCGYSVYMPSDGSKKPDYLISAGGFAPDISYLYCASCEAEYYAAFNFKSAQAGISVKLSDIIKTAHDIAGSSDIITIIIGELKGVVGASLSVPPCSGKNNVRSSAGLNCDTSVSNVNSQGGESASDKEGPYSFSQLRDNFNITAEPEYNGYIAVCAGISSIKPSPDSAVASFLRPLAPGVLISGHFHSSIFEFTPLKKNCKDPAELLMMLYEKKAPETVLHLINDWRAINGAGETEFINGTCWMVKISDYNI